MKAKIYMPRSPNSYNSQDYYWRDQYLTNDFKQALPDEDKLYLYDRLTSQSMLNLCDLYEVLETPEDKVQVSITDP